MSDRDFSFLVNVVATHLGIKLSSAKKPMVTTRLLRRLRRLKLPDFASYCEQLKDSAWFAEEFPHFSDLVTTHKTDFFREAEQFALLTQIVLPELQKSPSGHGPIRVWSAGCSTGQEPYTIAMVLDDYFGGSATPGFTVAGTDVSTFAIQTAQRGVYHASTTEPIPDEFRSRFLLRSRDSAVEQVRIVPKLRQCVSFECLNFVSPNWGRRGPFDVIFCRNVLIYFERATQENIIARLCGYLRPNGYLFLGLSETYVGSAQDVRGLGRSLYQRI